MYNDYMRVGELGKYINDIYFNNEKNIKDFIMKIYNSYDNRTYPYVVEKKKAAEIYLMFYLEKYMMGEINEIFLRKYFKALSIILINDFKDTGSVIANVNEIEIFIGKIAEIYDFFLELAKRKKLIILVHQDANINYKGSYTKEKYKGEEYDVINIYNNNNEIDYLFVLAHEIGHFIHLNKIQKFEKLENIIDDKEEIADLIAIFLISKAGYNIPYIGILEKNYKKIKCIAQILDKLDKDML